MKIKIIIIALSLFCAYLLWPEATINDWRIKNTREKYEHIVVFGDSLTTGYNIGAQHSYPKHLEKLLGQNVKIHGYNGMTSEAGLKVLPEILQGEPALWIVTLGGNDILKSKTVEQTEANMRSIFQQLQASGHTVVWTEVLPVLGGSNRYEMHRRVCREEGVLLVPDILDDILNDPKLQVDAIHPSSLGCELIAERVHEALVESLAFPQNNP